MNLFIYTGASRLNAAVVESATDLTPVSRLPDLIVGDSEPVTVKFLSASGTYESWSGGGTYTLSISIGALGGDGIAAYFQTSSFTTVTNGWTGRLNLASGSLPSVVAGYLAERPGAQSVPLFAQVRVTDADGNTETYARQAVSVSGAVSVPTTANSTPVTYATAADVAADASTASVAAIAAAASASAAAGSASTAAGHVTTAGNSATAAAASAVTAGNSATTASGHATTATTQATNAATSSSNASTYKDAAAVSAASATSSAGTATTQAALATTNGAAQVTLAAAQVTLATTQATNAGTSASAAAVSAAAALVSEAAALVSKNAAAASAATASAVSGSGNGTFSAAALTGVNSVTASASTALTLTGGSTGASLVLGATTSGVTQFYNGGGFQSMRIDQANRVIIGTGGALQGDKLEIQSVDGTAAQSIWRFSADAAGPSLTLRKSRGATIAAQGLVSSGDTIGNLLFMASDGVASRNAAQIAAEVDGTAAASSMPGRLVFRTTPTGSTTLATAATLTSTGNLLIGTTIDAASLAGGLIVNGSNTGAAASSTITGALRVTGGVGVSGAGYFGGRVVSSDFGVSNTNTKYHAEVSSNTATYIEATRAGIITHTIGSGGTNGGTLLFSSDNLGTYGARFASTVSASSSIAGALRVGDGSTAATNVAIGGGNVNAGGSITSQGNFFQGAAGSGTWITARSIYPDSTNSLFTIYGGNDATTWLKIYGNTHVTKASQAEITATATVLSSTSPSIGSTSGALQVAGGIYAGAASVFAGITTFTGANTVFQGSASNTDTILVRGTTSNGATHQYKTGATLIWYHGLRGLANNNWYLFNNNLSTNTLFFDASTDAATFAGAVSIGNTVGTAAAVASTHKVTMVIGGVTYYLLATNVP